MTPAALFDRAAARTLAFLQAGVRMVPKERRAAVTRRVRPAYERTLDRFSRPELRADERALRASITTDPRNAELWYRLGLCLAERGRSRKALDAWMTSAELGGNLDEIALAVLSQPSVHAIAATDRTVSRMCRIAEASPQSAETQLLAGAFLLDRGLLEPGRAAIERGYDLLFDGDRPPSVGTERDSSRAGPDFLIVGPAKTGSSSLYAFLTEHPRIIPAPRKELQFWRYRYDRSMETFEAYFPSRLPAGFITGEASTNTLTRLEAVPEIAKRYPRVQVIVLHREPVARSYSEFQMQRRSLAERRSFEQVVEFELAQNGDVPPVDATRLHDFNENYLVRSCILPFLESWVDALGPDQVMVVESDALSKHRQAAFDAVCEFLGVPSRPLANQDDRNVHHYDPIPASVAERLSQWFAPHEAALDAFLSDQPVVTFGR